MSKSAVFLAWGNPDRIRSGVRQGHPFEAWIYTTTRTIVLPDYYYAPGLYFRGGVWGHHHHFYVETDGELHDFPSDKVTIEGLPTPPKGTKPPPLASVRPSGENARQVTPPAALGVCGGSSAHTSPVFGSHSRTAPSTPPEAITRPSGDQATAVAPPG